MKTSQAATQLDNATLFNGKPQASAAPVGDRYFNRFADACGLSLND